MPSFVPTREHVHPKQCLHSQKTKNKKQCLWAVAHWRGHKAVDTASRSRGSEKTHEPRRSRVCLLCSSPRWAFPRVSFLSFSPPFHPPINNFHTRKPTESRAEPANFPRLQSSPPSRPFFSESASSPSNLPFHQTNPRRSSSSPTAAARSQATTAGAAAGVDRFLPPPPRLLLSGEETLDWSSGLFVRGVRSARADLFC